MQRDTGLYSDIQGHTRRYKDIEGYIPGYTMRYKDTQGTMYMHIFTQRYARIYIDQNWWAPLFEVMSLQHVAALQGTP